MKKKGLIIAIIVIVVLLILAGGAFAFIYFGTDLLLSERQGFEKYAIQIVTGENKFISSNMENYFNKKETTPYTTSGSISADTMLIGETATTNSTEVQKLTEILKYSDQAYISFDGKVDNANKKFEQNISINYSDAVKFPFTYRVDGDIFGIQSNEIGDTFIAIDNNNLPELFQKLGATDVTAVPNKLESTELQSANFTDEEKTHILNTYILPIYNSITDEKFSKQDNSDGSVTYTLTLTTQEMKNILVQALDILKEDQLMLDKLNGIVQELYGDNYNEATMEINQKSIQESISNIESASIEDDIIQLGITQTNRKVNKISINYGEIAIDISKLVSNQSGDNYNISMLKGGYTLFDLEISYSVIDTNSLNEQYIATVNIENNSTITYHYSNTVTFGSNISFEPLNATNSAILNSYSTEQLLPFLGQLGIRIVQINNEQMTALGYPTELINPVIMWFATPSIVTTIQEQENIYNNAQEGQQDFNETLEQDNENLNSIEEQIKDLYQNSETNNINVGTSNIIANVN